MIRARFKLNMSKVSDRIDHVVILVQQKVAMQLLRGIVNMNPVLSGRSRGNWYVTIGASTAAYQEEGYATSPEQVIQRGQDVVNQVTTLGAIYITNNTPYILELEKGTSTQAPQGMVQVTLDRIGAQFS